ncbi:AAA family ATPase [Clostridium sp.]|uniref:ATP-dependent DNA helicase n=1 Tax=Clostridium sp. TaxID=1506 RepID=UPI002FC6ACB1
MIKEIKYEELRIKEKLIAFKVNEEIVGKMLRDFGNDVLKVIEDKPYVLCHYMYDLELIKEIIEKNKGCKCKEESSKNIVAATIIHVLETVTAIEGHAFIYREELVVRAKKNDEIATDELIDGVLEHLELQGEIVIDKDTVGKVCIYPGNLYKAEVQVANLVSYLVESDKADNKDLEKANIFLKNYKCGDITLNDGQQEAVRLAVSRSISIVCGGAGNGKTTVIKAICDAFMYFGQSNIKLLSFTGKAVERASAITGIQATTIHRLLGLREDGRKKVDRIKADVIIVDEVGMLGLELFNMLIQSVKENKDIKLVLVGDQNQLPSIAPGNVFKDLIQSSVIPVVRMTETVRQEKDSLIIANSNKVLRGITLDGSNAGLRLKQGEFEFIEADSEKIKEKVISAIDKLLGKGESIYDIQVISPIKGGDNGVEELNRDIADKFNYVSGREVYKFGVLDPIIVVRNNSKKEVFNGQRGMAIRVERNMSRTEAVVVDFNGKEVTFQNNELDAIEVAYASTVHKMQGSESPIVVIVVDKEQSKMLTRELLYVAITRGAKRVILIGDKETFNIGVRNKSNMRNSLLMQRLKDINKSIVTRGIVR